VFRKVSLFLLILFFASAAFSSESMPNPVIQGTGGLSTILPSGTDALEYNPSRILIPRDESWHIHLDVQASPPVRAWDSWSPFVGDLIDGNRSILKDTSFTNLLWEYDGVPIEADLGTALGFSWKNYAIAGEIHVVSGGMLEHGSVLPRLSVWDSVSYLLRFGMAQSFGGWRVGQSIGLRGTIDYIDTASVYDPDEFNVIFNSLRDSLLEAPQKAPHWRATYTIGITREWQTGLEFSGALREIGRDSLGKLARPYFDLGGAWRWPQGLPSKWFPMQFTIGAQVNDILEINTPDAMLRRTGMGIECRQGFGGTALEIRSALGIQSGWPTAGLGISFFRVLQIDVATWAEEAGRYVGQNDMRHWTARVRFGGW